MNVICLKTWTGRRSNSPLVIRFHVAKDQHDDDRQLNPRNQTAILSNVVASNKNVIELTWLDRLLTMSGGSESLSVVLGESGMPIPLLYLVNDSRTSSVARSLIRPANDCSTSLKDFTWTEKLKSINYNVKIPNRDERTLNLYYPHDASNNSTITRYNSLSDGKKTTRYKIIAQ